MKNETIRTFSFFHITVEADSIELILLLLHREFPYKRISTLLLSDKDLNSVIKDFTLFHKTNAKITVMIAVQ